MSDPAFRITAAAASDVPLVLQFIKDLAEYEKLSHAVVADEAAIRTALFGPSPAAEVVIAYADDWPVGFALFFQTFSTFTGRPGLWLEDLFVKPEWRGRGYGRALLAHLAGIAVDRGYGRMEWSVLDWNELALRVYRKAGAQAMDEWTTNRLTGEPLRRLASERPR
ncbi:MAG TPA: GNAT family N-acetyltransferase [Vicinamibacterales bacterium]|nr:GNAT family N-acetyltransferase [Vicinamibacterales bacterium]